MSSSTRIMILALAWASCMILLAHISTHTDTSTFSPILHVSGQIIRSRMTELDRAREQALKQGRLRDLAQLRRHTKHRTSAAPDAPTTEDLLPAPAHIVLTPSGEQELYQPDREKHIRIPGRRPYPKNHPHQGSIKVPRPKHGSAPRTEHDQTNENPNQMESHQPKHGGNGGKLNQLRPTSPPDAAPITPPPTAPGDTDFDDPLNIPPGEDGRLFSLSKLTPEQQASLAAVDGGFETLEKKDEGYLATVVDAIIDPHSVIARPTNEGARGVMMIVLVPLFLFFFAFLAYSCWIYKKRVELEEKQAAHAAEGINSRRKAKAAKTIAGVESSIAAAGASTVPTSSVAAAKQKAKNQTSHKAGERPTEEDDWAVYGHDDDDL